MIKRAPDNVRYLGQFGEHILTRSFTARDRGCVKTLKSQQAGELFSLLPFFRSRPPRYSSSDWRNQEGFSTRRLNACVFAQAGPLTVIGRRRNQATAKTRR